MKNMTLSMNDGISARIKNGKPEDKEYLKALETVKQKQFTVLCLTQQEGGDYPKVLDNAKIIIKHHLK